MRIEQLKKAGLAAIGSLGALAWTQAAYPVAAAGLARLRGRSVRFRDIEPDVSLIVAY